MKVAPEIDASALASGRQRELYWAVWSVVAAFGTYFFMFAFRKPFTAVTYSDFEVAGLSFKTVLVASQVAGYMVAKFIGIKVISEMPPQRRAAGILALIVAAEVALVLFGLVPRPWNAICLFFNGMPLGMVFGLVLGFLEGRRLTEALTAGLCASFILADGVMKSVGAWLLARNVAEDWMPSLAGLLFLVPLAVCVAMLACIPPPNPADIAARAVRAPMTGGERWRLYRRYALGLTLLVAMYLLITIARSLRGDFAPEIWRGLGATVAPATFTQSEIYVALGVLLVNGALVAVRDSRWAFFIALAVCAAGLGLAGVALLGLQARLLGGFGFMVLIGLGLYLPYVAFHTTVFERFLAMTRERGNIAFLMYVADSIGYLGYIAVMISRNLYSGDRVVTAEGEFVVFFTWLCWGAIGLSAACLALAWRYFAVKCPPPQTALAPAGATPGTRVQYYPAVRDIPGVKERREE